MTCDLITRAEWFCLPLEMRQRWWRETSYRIAPPSPELVAIVFAHLGKGTPPDVISLASRPDSA